MNDLEFIFARWNSVPFNCFAHANQTSRNIECSAHTIRSTHFVQFLCPSILITCDNVFEHSIKFTHTDTDTDTAQHGTAQQTALVLWHVFRDANKIINIFKFFALLACTSIRSLTTWIEKFTQHILTREQFILTEWRPKIECVDHNLYIVDDDSGFERQFSKSNSRHTFRSV